MKKSILFSGICGAMLLSSCSTVISTANTESINTKVNNYSTADLVVADKSVSYTFYPEAKHRRAGLNSMKAAAVNRALEQAGGADVLLAPQFEVVKRRNLFRTKVREVKVKGLPATYRNVHSTTKNEAEVIDLIEHDGKKKDNRWLF